MSAAMSATVSTWSAPIRALRTLPGEAPLPTVGLGVPTASDQPTGVGSAVPFGPSGPSWSHPSAWSSDRPRTPEADSARVRQRESSSSDDL